MRVPTIGPPSLRHVLALIVLLPTLAATVFACWLIGVSYQRELDRAQVSSRNTAMRIATELHGRLAVVQAGLAGVAGSAPLETAEGVGRLHQQASAFAANLQLRGVALFDLQAWRWIFSTLVPLGTELPPPARDGRSGPLLQGRSVVRLAPTPVGGEPLVVVSVPVMVGGTARYAISASIPAAEMQRMTGLVDLPPGGILAILDNDDRIVARNVDAAKYVGKQATQSLRDALATDDSGIFRSRTQDGHEVFTVFSRGQWPGWTVVIGIPASAVTAKLVSSTYLVVAIGAALVGAALLLAWIVARRVARGVDALVAGATPLARAQVITLAPVGLREADSLQETLMDASRQLHALHERVLLQNQEMTEMALSAAHDLRTPLISLGGYADVLALRHASELGPQGLARLERMRAAIAQLGMLLDGMSRLSRVEVREGVQEVVDLGSTVARCLSLLHPDIDMAQAQVDVAGPLPPVLGDANALVQLLMNLVSNAIKYRSPDRALRVRIAGARLAGGLVQVEVSDNGSGIPADQRDDAFVLFRRLRPEASTGSGIGLTLCRKIVRQHGGEIWIDDHAGPGTVVKFTLRGAT